MNIALWIAQILLAFAFGAAGIMKSTQPHEKLTANMGWPGDYSPGFVKFVGVVEILGALGLILPAVTGIAPVLVPIAASGLAIEQVGAIAVHARRKERQPIIANVVLIALALFVAWGRFGDYPL
jgi:uncharacterized membrane protein YphA (DoxX/SURF4 family)